MEEPTVLTFKATIEETLLSPNKEVRQSTQFGSSTTKTEELSIATNVPKLTTPDSTFNLFGYLDWVVEEG